MNLFLYQKTQVLLLLLLLILGCGMEQHSQNTKEEGGTKTFLTSETINFLKPDVLKRSTESSLQNDLIYFQKDTQRLTLIQNRLKSMEIKDSEIDIFVDNSVDFRIVIISNLEKTEFSKQDASILQSHIISNNRKIELENPEVKIESIESKEGGKPDLYLVKFKSKMTNHLDSTEIYNSLFYLSTKSSTIVLIEFSSDSTDLERTMWTFRDN